MPENRTLLLVEDERNLRDVMSTVLRRAGYVVLEASSGTEAMEAVTAYSDIDVLVADIRLPDMYGRRLGERIAEARSPAAPALGILYVSGNPHETTQGAPLAPNERFLAKPFEFEDMLAVLAEIPPGPPVSPRS